MYDQFLTMSDDQKKKVPPPWQGEVDVGEVGAENILAQYLVVVEMHF